MAGNRQHIIPRFLLKGFVGREKGGKLYTWVYPKNKPPSEANIRRVGVERHFYGKQGEMSVDDDITEFEGKYALLLDELRQSPGEIEIFDTRVPNLVTHLVTRTKHFRDSFRESMEFLMQKMTEYFSNSNNLKEAMLSIYLKNPDMMRESIDEGFEKHPELKPFENILRPLFPSLFFFFSKPRKMIMHYFSNTFIKI